MVGNPLLQLRFQIPNHRVKFLLCVLLIKKTLNNFFRVCKPQWKHQFLNPLSFLVYFSFNSFYFLVLFVNDGIFIFFELLQIQLFLLYCFSQILQLVFILNFHNFLCLINCLKMLKFSFDLFFVFVSYVAVDFSFLLRKINESVFTTYLLVQFRLTQF